VAWSVTPTIFFGGFGGTDINNRGQVCGLSDLTGDQTTHAFFWRDDGPGHSSWRLLSVAWGIGDSGQVLGQSCDVNFNCRGFVWQDGVMTEVNALLPPRSTLYVVDANFINAAGDHRAGGRPCSWRHAGDSDDPLRRNRQRSLRC
jgi:probable HAF family extracellular repeat protein